MTYKPRPGSSRRGSRTSPSQGPGDDHRPFIAASPEDQKPLRLDREVREIQQRVRASEHRDSVQFEMRLATQLGDILQALNETRPHVVHFSGDGNQGALAFEDDDGRTKPLTNEMLERLLSAASDRIHLMVLNGCRSSTQAELALDYIDVGSSV